MARRKLKRKKSMYQTEGVMDTPLNPPILGGFNPERDMSGMRLASDTLPAANVMDTAARGISSMVPTSQITSLGKTPSLYETYSKAGINIPEGFMDATDDEIKARFGKAYDLKTQLMRGGFLEPGVEEI